MRKYYVQAPGWMTWEMRVLTKKQVANLRAQGHTVER